MGRFDGLVVTSTGLPPRDMNLAFTERRPGDPGRALAAAEDWCEGRGHGLAVDLEDGVHPRVHAAIRGMGLQAAGTRPAMTLDLRRFAPAGSPDHEVRMVSGEDGRRSLVRVEADGFGFGLETVDRLLSPRILQEPNLVCYLGLVDRTPAGAALVHFDHGAAGVYWVATVPWARSRGVATAVLIRALTDSARRADLAWLQASTAGRPVYEAMGFRWAGDWTVWARPTG